MRFMLDGKLAVVAPPNCVACGEPASPGGEDLTVRATSAKVSLKLAFPLCAACAGAKQHEVKNSMPTPVGCLVHFVLFAAALGVLVATSASTEFRDYTLGNWAAVVATVMALVLPPAVLLRVIKNPKATTLSDDEARRLTLLKKPATLRIKADHFTVTSVDLTFANPAFSVAFASANPLSRIQ